MFFLFFAIIDSHQKNITAIISNCLWIVSFFYQFRPVAISDGAEKFSQDLFESTRDKILSNTHKYEFWLEEVRTLDLLMAAGRMRGWRWRQND